MCKKTNKYVKWTNKNSSVLELDFFGFFLKRTFFAIVITKNGCCNCTLFSTTIFQMVIKLPEILYILRLLHSNNINGYSSCFCKCFSLVKVLVRRLSSFANIPVSQRPAIIILINGQSNFIPVSPNGILSMQKTTAM